MYIVPGTFRSPSTRDRFSSRINVDAAPRLPRGTPEDPTSGRNNNRFRYLTTSARFHAIVHERRIAEDACLNIAIEITRMECNFSSLLDKGPAARGRKENGLVEAKGDIAHGIANYIARGK